MGSHVADSVALICRSAFQCTSHSLESLVQESKTAGSRHGRHGGGSSCFFFCSQAWQHEGTLHSPSRMEPHYCFARRRPLTVQEKLVGHGVPSVGSVYLDSHRLSPRRKWLMTPSRCQNMGVTPCAPLAVVSFGRGRCLQETRLMSQCWFLMHIQRQVL